MFALRTTPLAVLAIAALALPAAAQVEAPQVTEQETLVQALEADGQFTQLVEAIRAAGLEEALAGEGPYTIFAPTDAAFAALPEGKLDELKANPEMLKSVLGLHVVQQSVAASTITEEAQRLPTLAGTEIEVVREGETVRVQPAPGPAREVMGEEETATPTSATVERADWTASNGTIHVINTVHLPAS